MQYDEDIVRLKDERIDHSRREFSPQIDCSSLLERNELHRTESETSIPTRADRQTDRQTDRQSRQRERERERERERKRERERERERECVCLRRARERGGERAFHW